MSSGVASFYKGKSVLLTGVTGFLGHLLAEKLLRSCPGLDKLYVIVRSKAGQTPRQRINQMLDDQFFDRVKCERPDLEDRLVLLTGELSDPGLGLDTPATAQLLDKVNVVIHSAASINMKESLANSVRANLVATKEVVNLAKNMKHLQSFVYISTAYSHCNREKIDETFYPAPYDPVELCRLYSEGDHQALEALGPQVRHGRPNNYVAVKAVAEELVRREMKGMPASVFRPSMIAATRWEPMPGWMQSWLSVSGVFAQVYRGAVRTVCLNLDSKLSLIPADMTANAIIVAAANNKAPSNKDEDMPVYNYTTAPGNLVTGRELYKMSQAHIHEYPTVKAVGYPQVRVTSDIDTFRVLHTFRDLLPAAGRDLANTILFRKRKNVKRVLFIEYFMDSLRCFMVKDWEFDCGNVTRMWNALSPSDKKHFPFDMDTVEWDEYMRDMLMGARLYLMDDPLQSLPKAKIRMKWLYYKRPLFWLVVVGAVGKVIFF